MEYKYIIVGIIILFGIFVLIKNKRIAQNMQSLYITQAKKGSSGSVKWEQPWILTLFRVMVIFFGFLIIVVAYPLLFGPYNA